MKIDFEGRTWSYDDDLITVGQAEQIEDAGPWEWTLTSESGEIETKSGRSVYDWRQAVSETSAKAFRHLYWIMREQNGDPVPLGEVSFTFPKFVAAFMTGWRAEVTARVAEQEGEAGSHPTQAAGTSPPPGKPAGEGQASSRHRSSGS